MRRRNARIESLRLMATAAGIGAVAGLRSMTAPALVTWAAQQKWIDTPRRLKFLKNKRLAIGLAAAAVGELVVDKLPGTPSRTQPVSLAARAVSGGLCAAALCAPKKKLIVAGAVVGAAAAIGGAYAGYAIRKRVDEKFAVNDAIVALVEDGVASGAGALLLRAA